MRLPKGWIAPRKEFLIAGFNCERHTYGFDAAPLTVTTLKPRSKRTSTTVIIGARCCECDGVMTPDRDTLVEHAKLHLAVKLAKEPTARANKP
jgi:hypothetical protein